jgi:hypothetical protein
MNVPMIVSLLRYLVAAAGGGAMTISDSELEKVASALLIIVPILLSLWSKRQPPVEPPKWPSQERAAAVKYGKRDR